MRLISLATGLLIASTALAGCSLGAPTPSSITIYSGRSEELVGPLIERFESETGISAEVRYGDTAELAATILEEGANTPADVFFAQDAGALGAVAQADLFEALPAEVLDRVPAALRSPDGEWVGVSGRARVVVYDSRELTQADLPTSIDGFTDPEWSGRLGWAPTNGSFQAFVTALRMLEGEDAARAWLEGIVANEPRSYEGNTQVVQAVADGEIDAGFVNHYYLLRFLEEQGESFPARNHFMPGGDPGSLVNVAGAGILAASDADASARRLVEFLLSDESQAYFAQETFEYPLIAGADGPAGMPSLDQIQTPDIDLSDLADLQGTLRLLSETGALP
jgi:iron(III) transport system substrate-binding protein